MAASVFPSLSQFREQLEFQAELLEGSVNEDLLRRLDPAAVFRDAIQGDGASSENLREFLTNLKDAKVGSRSLLSHDGLAALSAALWQVCWKKSSSSNPAPTARGAEQMHESSPISPSHAASETRPGGAQGSIIRALQPTVSGKGAKASPEVQKDRNLRAAANKRSSIQGNQGEVTPVNTPQPLASCPAPTPEERHKQSKSTAQQQQHGCRQKRIEVPNFANSPGAVQPAGWGEKQQKQNQQRETAFREKLLSLCQFDEQIRKLWRLAYEKLALTAPKLKEMEAKHRVVQMFMESAKTDPQLYAKIWTHEPVQKKKQAKGTQGKPGPAAAAKSSRRAAQATGAQQQRACCRTPAVATPPAEQRTPNPAQASPSPGNALNAPTQLGSASLAPPAPQASTAAVACTAGAGARWQNGHVQAHVQSQAYALQNQAQGPVPVAAAGAPQGPEVVGSQQQQAGGSEIGDMNTAEFNDALVYVATREDDAIKALWYETHFQQKKLHPEVTEVQLYPFVMTAVKQRLAVDPESCKKIWAHVHSRRLELLQQQQQQFEPAPHAWGVPAPPQTHPQPPQQPLQQQAQPQAQQQAQPQQLFRTRTCGATTPMHPQQQQQQAAINAAQGMPRPQLAAALSTGPRTCPRPAPQPDTATAAAAAASAPQGGTSMHSRMMHQHQSLNMNMPQQSQLPSQPALPPSAAPSNAHVGAHAYGPHGPSGHLQSAEASGHTIARCRDSKTSSQPLQQQLHPMSQHAPIQHTTHCGTPGTPVKSVFPAQSTHMSPTTPDMHALPVTAVQHGNTLNVVQTGHDHRHAGATGQAVFASQQDVQCPNDSLQNEMERHLGQKAFKSTPSKAAGCAHEMRGQLPVDKQWDAAQGRCSDYGNGPSTPDRGEARGGAACGRGGASGANALRDTPPVTPQLHKNAAARTSAMGPRHKDAPDAMKLSFRAGGQHVSSETKGTTRSAVEDLVKGTSKNTHRSSAEMDAVEAQQCNAQAQADSARSSAEDVATGVAIPPDSGSPPESAPVEASLDAFAFSADLGATATDIPVQPLNINSVASIKAREDVRLSSRDAADAAANADAADAAANADAAVAAARERSGREVGAGGGGLERGRVRRGCKRSLSRVTADGATAPLPAANHSGRLRSNPPRTAAYGAAAAILHAESSERAPSVDAGGGGGGVPAHSHDADIDASQPSNYVSSQLYASGAAPQQASTSGVSSRPPRRRRGRLPLRGPGRGEKLSRIANRKTPKGPQAADFRSSSGLNPADLRLAGTIAFRRRRGHVGPHRSPGHPADLEPHEMQHFLEGGASLRSSRDKDRAQNASSCLNVSSPKHDGSEQAQGFANSKSARSRREHREEAHAFAADAASGDISERRQASRDAPVLAAAAAAAAAAPRHRRTTGSSPPHLDKPLQLPGDQDQMQKQAISPRDCPSPIHPDLASLVPDNFPPGSAEDLESDSLQGPEFDALLRHFADDSDLLWPTEGPAPDAPEAATQHCNAESSPLQAMEDVSQELQPCKADPGHKVECPRNEKKPAGRCAGQLHTGATKKKAKRMREHHGAKEEATKVFFTEPPNCLTDEDKKLERAAWENREARDVHNLETHISSLDEEAKRMPKNSERRRVLYDKRIAYLQQVMDELNKPQIGL